MASSAWNMAEEVCRNASTLATEMHVAGILLLHGPSGTGKSYLSATVGVGQGGVYRVTLGPETPSAELRGHWINKGGSTIWHHGPVARAMLSGGRLVLDEITHGPQDCFSFLHAVCEDPALIAITLPNGETIRPAAGFHVIATSNDSPEDLPGALRDRFPFALEITEPAPGAIAALPEDLQAIATGTACLGDDDIRRVSVRRWAAYAGARGILGEETARVLTFGAQADEVATALALAVAK